MGRFKIHHFVDYQEVKAKGLKLVRFTRDGIHPCDGWGVQVTGKGLGTVAGRCRSLQVLSVAGCSRLTDEALAELATCGMLSQLSVNNVPHVGAATMRALASFCRCLFSTQCTLASPSAYTHHGIVSILSCTLYHLPGIGCHGPFLLSQNAEMNHDDRAQ